MRDNHMCKALPAERYASANAIHARFLEGIKRASLQLCGARL